MGYPAGGPLKAAAHRYRRKGAEWVRLRDNLLIPC